MTYSLTQRKALSLPFVFALENDVPLGSTRAMLMFDHGLMGDLEVVQTGEDVRFGDGGHFGERDPRAFVVRCECRAGRSSKSTGELGCPGRVQVVAVIARCELLDVGEIDSAADSTECGAESA